jgi:hypothetical protein
MLSAIDALGASEPARESARDRDRVFSRERLYTTSIFVNGNVSAPLTLWRWACVSVCLCLCLYLRLGLGAGLGLGLLRWGWGYQ